MVRMIRSAGAMLAASAVSALMLISAGTGSAEAVVYCKTVGVPKGCVVRPVRPVVVAPRVVAPRVTVRRAVVVPGRVGNRGGPVNRVGRF